MHTNKLSSVSWFSAHAVAVAVRLLERRDRALLIGVIIISLFLSFLDLLGVILIGVIASLSITGLSTGQVGDRVSRVLNFLNLDDLQLEEQVSLIGIIVALSLIGKSLLSLYFVKRTQFFMARRGAVISSNLLAKYFTLSVARINKRSVQASIYALTGGVGVLMVGVIGALVSLFSDIALLLIMGIGLFIIDPITTLTAALLFGALAYVLYMNMHMKVKSIGEQQSTLEVESSQRIFEVISSYRELLVRDRRGYYAQQISGIRFRLSDGQALSSFMGSISKYVLEIALVICALVLAFYQFTVSTPFRAIATLSIFVAASTRITPAILRLQQGLLGVQRATAQAKPTLELIDELSSLESKEYRIKSLTREHQGFLPKIVLKKLNFEYESNRRVIKDISFEVSAGEFVAIVGSSGAGKSTLVDLILGALDPINGEVAISNLPPMDVFAKWPGAVSYVPQDSPIIEGTIRENLGLGFPVGEIADEYCWESLELARLSEFVKSLPEELESYVGDRGTRLSGGQKQRLGIARALITKPRLLILDEATSSLDAVTESEISDSLRGLKGDTTLVVIAHRLSTILDADRIYLLDDGALKGVGTFHELKSRFPEFLEQAELLGL